MGPLLLSFWDVCVISLIGRMILIRHFSILSNISISFLALLLSHHLIDILIIAILILMDLLLLKNIPRIVVPDSVTILIFFFLSEYFGLSHKYCVVVVWISLQTTT